MIIRSPFTDPCRNLAAEEWLLNHVTEPTLYLWQNAHTIVIGRHQNPFRELDVTRFQTDGGKIVRRLSGGGTVYHDLGNLNFTFLFPREQYDAERSTEVLLHAVRMLGIPAEKSGRNDLTAEGRKFSGNAFCVRKHGAYHHGTLLVHTDMEKLGRYLTVDPAKIQSKGIQSVRSRVVNLCEYRPDLTIDDLKEAVIDAFLNVFGGNGALLDTSTLPKEEIDMLTAKYASWDWTFGESPDFGVRFVTRFPWGGISMAFMSEDGKITSVSVETDAMDTELGDVIPFLLNGVAYDAESIAAALRSGAGEVSHLEEIAAWIVYEI